MALTAAEAEKLNKVNAGTQQVALGDQIADLQAGKSITLPTSDPGVAGELYSDSGIVTVSAGA